VTAPSLNLRLAQTCSTFESPTGTPRRAGFPPALRRIFGAPRQRL
jgi:hypothetical protein